MAYALLRDTQRCTGTWGEAVVGESGELAIRLSVFLGVFGVLAMLEALLPRRARMLSRWTRWLSNVGISLLNQVVVRTIVPASAVAVALMAQDREWGLLALFDLADWVEIVVAIIVLDLAVYLQHRIYHLVPILWRFHRMHHADTEFDVTTGIRFHPVSVLLSALIKIGVATAIGASPSAVLIFEVLLNATSLFNHSNLAIPPRVDRLLRLVVVTPDMHRVHHSRNGEELNHNFGFNFPWWDRLFRSYAEQPVLGHEAMEIGLDQFRDVGEQRLDRLLLQPFRH